MNTKELVLVVTFAGLAIVLNPAVSRVGLPFPPLPNLILNVWEIPVMIIFLLVGYKSGILVAVLNSLFLFAVWPGPSQPLLALGSIVSMSSMMLGIYVLLKFKSKDNPEFYREKRIVVYATLTAIVLRILVMAPVMYAVAKSPVFDFPDTVIFGVILPWQAVYNIIQPLITIPIAFLIARQINKSIKINNRLF